MKIWISILRGINVGGRNPIKMDSLREMYTQLGFSDVKSYIQSGNLIFKCNSEDSRFIEKTISEGILKSFGFTIAVLVLNPEDLRNSIVNNPYLSESSKEQNQMHLTFLSEQPDNALINTISEVNFFPDEFRMGNKVVYLFCPVGYGNTKLNNNFFEKKLKVSATTRNLKTVLEILDITDKYV